jgi:nuclear transport factor 2 (NTF2) superfamily protein
MFDYTTIWREGAAFPPGRELDYALRKNMWAFRENRIAVRFQYESHDAQGQSWRSYGNELWEFDEHGLMRRREASINDVAIEESKRRIFGPRPAGERGVEFPDPVTAADATPKGMDAAFMLFQGDAA